MSTDIYLECRIHDPHARSYDAVGSLGSLDNIRETIKQRDELLKLAKEAERLDFTLEHWDGRMMQMLRFFREHPKCDLGIVDEYGHRHPLNPFTEEELAAREAELEKIVKFIKDAVGVEVLPYQKNWLRRIYENKDR